MAGERALQYYEGNPTLPLRLSARINDNLPLPMARIIVDKGAAFLFGRDVETQIAEDDAEGPQEWLLEAWRRNKRPIFLQKLGVNGGIFGHAFIRLLDSHPYPRVIVIDPLLVDVQTEPDDCDSVWQYTITQPEQSFDADGDGVPDENVRKRTVFENRNRENPEEPPEWVIFEQEYRGATQGGSATAGGWVTLSEMPWPYPFAPVLACQNIPKPNDYWGESDLPPDVLTIIDGINRVASNYNKVVRLFASPKIWTRGMGSQKLDLSADAVTHLPSETAELRALEMQSDLGSTMALLEKLLALLSYAVRIPLIALGEPDGLGALSGVSLKVRYQPLVEKTNAKRLTYGDMLEECDRCLLIMGGFGDGYRTNLRWPEIVPQDDLADRQVAVLDDSLGIVSKETLAAKFNYDYDYELQQIADERQAAIAAGLMPDPALVAAAAQQIPPPQPIQAPQPDTARGRTSE